MAYATNKTNAIQRLPEFQIKSLNYYLKRQQQTEKNGFIEEMAYTLRFTGSSDL